jgi:homoserine O-acetyltransferase
MKQNNMNKHIINFPETFETESGTRLSGLDITFHTAGTFTENSKVVWICHALTANSNPEEWWHGMVGDGCLYNGNDYFIICVNILGSCYGTTGAL